MFYKILTFSCSFFNTILVIKENFIFEYSLNKISKHSITSFLSCKGFSSTKVPSLLIGPFFLYTIFNDGLYNSGL